MNLLFVNHIKGDLYLQVPENMTVKEMVMKYCSKIVESPDKFGKTIFLAYFGNFAIIFSALIIKTAYVITGFKFHHIKQIMALRCL